MATKWVYLARWKASARLKVGAAVCTGLIAHCISVTAQGQETTDGVQAESAVTQSDTTTNAAASGETAVAPTATGELASGAASEVPPPSAAPAQQSGSFVQRFSDRLHGVIPTQPIPVPVPAANRDPRADLLDTSFPAEQPEQTEPEPNPGVPFNSRRTEARTANGITEISNRPYVAGAEELPAVNRAVTPKVSLSRPQVNTEINTPRLESQVSLPSSSIARTGSGMSPWVWVLAGTAALLLVPIAFLLTRPTR